MVFQLVSSEALFPLFRIIIHLCWGFSSFAFALMWLRFVWVRRLGSINAEIAFTPKTRISNYMHLICQWAKGRKKCHVKYMNWYLRVFWAQYKMWNANVWILFQFTREIQHQPVCTLERFRWILCFHMLYRVCLCLWVCFFLSFSRKCLWNNGTTWHGKTWMMRIQCSGSGFGFSLLSVLVCLSHGILLMAQHQSRQHQCKIQFNHLFTAHENMFNKCSHKFTTQIIQWEQVGRGTN